MVNTMLTIYRISDQSIQAKVGTPFTIELEGNPTTGYEWQVPLDESKLELVKQEYQPLSGNFGSGELTRFVIRPIATGEALIRAVYQRSWETTPAQQHDFRVLISS